MKFKEVRLRDIIEFKNGKKRPKESGNIPVYGGNGILGYTNKSNSPQNSLIIGRVGAYCGCVYKSDAECWISDNAIVGYARENNSYNFLYYYLKSLNLHNLHIGSGHPLITQDILNNIKIEIPNYNNQLKIGKILLCIDKKIQLNNQINDNLYKILRLNFNNWVDNLEIYTKTNLSSIANYKNGLAMQKYRPIDEEGLPVIKIKEMNSGLSNDTERCSSDINKDVIVNDGDVLFAWSGTLCMTIWCNGKAGLNQHIFKVTSEKFPKWFYYCWTLKHLDRFIQIAAGKATTMGHIKRNELDNAEVLLPDNKEILEMDKIMTPLLEKYIENLKENKRLEQLRNTLLPKLMNGEIDLDKIEI